MKELKFNLGGIGRGGEEYKTVNLAETCDIDANIMDLDSFCEDGTVDEFYLSHTLEHISLLEYKKFLLHMKQKLKDGGTIKVIQTDIGRLIKLWTDGKITFRTMRAPIFTPATRCDSNILQQHQSMWSQEELINITKGAGVFILPSRHEQWGVVIHEFTSAGLPLIISDNVGSAPVFFVERYNGVSFNNNSAVDLAKAMWKMSIKPDSELIEMSKNSIEFSKRITPSTQAANLMSVI
jgi:glycosyltransferase involved in cell wall biosynthesis